MAMLPLPAASVRGPSADAHGGVVSTARAQDAGGTAAAGSDAAATHATGLAPGRLRRGLSSWDPQLQKQLSDAQQARDFLDRMAAQLQGLKADLSAKLAGLQRQDDQLQAKLEQVASLATARQAASGGSLDPQLRFSSPEPATQRFRIRGLALASLATGSSETLTIATGRGSTAINIAAGLTPAAIVQRFDQALAPAGLRAASDDSGALVFSVAESAWPGVRDNLAIKGAGIRFPTGQMTRVQADPEPAVLQPEAWKAARDWAATQRALAQVVQALERVRDAHAGVSRALAQASARVDQAASSDDADAAAALAARFEATGSETDYGSMASVSAAVAGVSPRRVLSLLALPAGA